MGGRSSAVPTLGGCQWCCPHKPSYGVSPRTQRQEAAEGDSNPGKSLSAGNLLATCLLQPRGSFTTSRQHSSRPAEGSKDNSAQGRGPNPPGPPTRTAWSQAAHTASQRALGTKRPPGAPGSGQSWLPWVVRGGGDLREAQQSPRRHNHGHQQ